MEGSQEWRGADRSMGYRALCRKATVGGVKAGVPGKEGLEVQEESTQEFKGKPASQMSQDKSYTSPF